MDYAEGVFVVPGVRIAPRHTVRPAVRQRWANPRGYDWSVNVLEERMSALNSHLELVEPGR